MKELLKQHNKKSQTNQKFKPVHETYQKYNKKMSPLYTRFPHYLT